MLKGDTEIRISLKNLLFIGILFVILLVISTIRLSNTYTVSNFSAYVQKFGLDLAILLFSGIVSTILFKYIFKRRTEVEEINFKLDSLNDLKFRDTSMEKFIDSIHEKSTTSIKILAHTGEELVTSFLNGLKRTDYRYWRKINIKILIRDPSYETGKRADGIKRTMDKIKEFQNKGFKKISVKYYSSLPTFRAILCNYANSIQEQNSFISFYHFPANLQSKQFYKSLLFNNKGDENLELVKIVNSWFDHFWGKKEKARNKHTIVLDFDDTIVNSHNIQIEAWTQLIKESEGLGIISKSNVIYSKYKDIKRVFFKKQHAKNIFSSIFKDIDYDTIDKLQQRRFEIRAEKMRTANVKVFPGVRQALKKLSKDYNLIIVSATDELLIRKYLEKNKIDKYFTNIFGKQEPVFSWQDIDRKSKLLLKIVSITGVSLDRIIYIGDNNGDYEATKRINIDFIEARLFSNEVNKSIGSDSLIFNNLPRKYITSWKNYKDLKLMIEGIA